MRVRGVKFLTYEYVVEDISALMRYQWQWNSLRLGEVWVIVTMQFYPGLIKQKYFCFLLYYRNW